MTEIRVQILTIRLKISEGTLHYYIFGHTFRALPQWALWKSTSIMSTALVMIEVLIYQEYERIQDSLVQQTAAFHSLLHFDKRKL